MRESPKALRAYEDYLGLGADRSLTVLLARYQTAEDPPTRSLGMLKKWSANFDWPSRIDVQLDREREEAEARFLEQRQAEFDDGLSLDCVRLGKLKALAAKLGTALAARLAEGGRVDEITKMTAAFRGVLSDIAAETGGRVKRMSVKRELTEYAIELARKHGYEESVAVEIAEMIARDAA
jgi:hypothetical protein